MNGPINPNLLSDLEEALEELSSLTLPTKTRSVLQTARTRLDQLSSSISAGSQEDRRIEFYRISQSLGLTLDQDEVLNQVMDAIIELTGAERGFLTLIDPASSELLLRAARNIKGQNLHSEDMEVSRTVIQSVIDTGEGIVTTNAQTDPRFKGKDSVVYHSLRSILCAPLNANGKIIGVIYAENRGQSGIFTPEDLDLINAFASQATIAIENARLYTHTDQALTARLSELETLSQVDRELNAELDLGRAIEITRYWITKRTTAEECWVGLTNNETGLLQLFSSPINGQFQEPDLTISAEFSEKIEPQNIFEDSKAYLVTPLLHADEILGAIVVTSRSELSPEEKEFLTRLASRAAAAIANAKLFQAVQQANESKSQFVSIVTHELRIPLTSIKGYTDLIRQGVVGEVNQQQLSFLDVIHNNVQRMSRLISDLSDISRIERGKLHLESAPLYLHNYVDETISSLRHKVDEKNQTLTSKVPNNLPTIFADPNRLVQVLTNLVSNAWKYTPKGGQIIVSASQSNGFVRVEIIDNGIGINTEDQTKLFTQFFRSEAQEVREQTGWGLGLNVTKRLVEIMGGEIGFSSVPDQGSIFWFTVPIG